jgi:hypothetical protein
MDSSRDAGLEFPVASGERHQRVGALGALSGATADERDLRRAMTDCLTSSPIPADELLHNVGLYLTRHSIGRILYIAELYRQIVGIHGVIMEFGVRWGRNLSLFAALRSLYEPFNYNRKIVGFDTFAGFPGTTAEDGDRLAAGNYAVTAGYETHLATVLGLHEAMSPIAHIKKHELVKGDAVETIKQYVDANPHTIVALAYFDFDIYKPTKACLETILPRVPKGGILAFDELNFAAMPGETLAVLDTIGLQKYELRRTPFEPLCAYMRVE